MQSSLVVGGHSHIIAFAPPSPDVDATAPVAVQVDGATVVTAPLPRDDAYWAAFEEAARAGVPVIVWAGDAYLRALLAHPSPPLDFVLSAAPDLPLDPRAAYVAEAHLRALFEPELAPLAGLIARLGAAAPTGVVLVAGTPPPIGDITAIVASLDAESESEQMGDGEAPPPLDPEAITSIYVLQKAWSLTQIMLAEVAEATGALFVPVPDRTRNSEGFLVPACWSGDPIHANATYGREMLADLQSAADSLTRSANR